MPRDDPQLTEAEIVRLLGAFASADTTETVEGATDCLPGAADTLKNPVEPHTNDHPGVSGSALSARHACDQTRERP